MSKPRGVRWGRVDELDRRIHVGSPAFSEYPTRLQHLAAWRFLHKLRHHRTIHNAAARLGVSPSSNLRVKQKVALAQKFSSRKGSK